MFELEVPAVQIVARTVIVYLVLFLALRVAGKREIGQMTTFDLVLILLVANAVQNAMVGPDTSLTGGLIAAGVLIGGNALVDRTADRIPWLRRTIEGSPTLLVKDGQIILPNLRREGIDADEVLMALREHGVGSLQDVQIAVLETDGSISVVPVDSSVTRTKRHARFVRKP
jgi:uncharacterized membrane protein YcaP (DUF421 family)